MDTAQDYKKLLTDAIQKQIIILGPQMTWLKIRSIPGITVSSQGVVTALSDTPQNIITHFLEQFRDLSSPLVKKTMKPLLSVIGTPIPTTPETKQEHKGTMPENLTGSHPPSENSEHSANLKL